MLTAAQADALAAPFKPAPRAGVAGGVPITLEQYRQIEQGLTRPITDTDPHEGVRIRGGLINTTAIGEAVPYAELSARAARDTDAYRARERERHRRRRAEQRAKENGQ